LLEQGEENSPCHLIKAYPKLFPWTLGLEEMEEDVYKRGVPKMVAEDCKRLHKGPVVGVQLGRGHINLR